MLKRLVLVRHGEAEFMGPEGTDESRRLTPQGKEELEKAYPATFEPLKGLDDVTIWVSSAIRAQQTALVIAELLGIEPEDFDLHLSLYTQDDDEFLAELEAEGQGTVIAVGHVPFTQRMLFKLTGEDLPFTKGSVASLTFADGDPSKAQLEWYKAGPQD